MKQVIDLLTGRPGAGKTETILRKIVATPGRYLLACPRIDLIRERIDDLARHAKALGVALPIIEEAHSQTLGVETVARQLSDARGRYENAAHVVILTTHQALIETDLLDWNGWHARLDEAPVGVKSHAWKIPATAALFGAMYDLAPVEGHPGWFHISPTADCTTLGSLMRDDCLGEKIVELHKAVMRPQGAFTTLGNWSDLIGSSRAFEWASVWTPYELRAFASCEIASAAYRHGLTHLAAEYLYPDRIELRDHVIHAAPRGAAPVEIVYFTRHHGSTEYWEKDPMGRQCLEKVRDYLAGQKIGFSATNRKFTAEFEGRLPGKKVSPKTEGTNALRHHTSCAFIYSAKRQPADKLLQQLFPVMSDERIERAREIEDILQFVFRGCIRMSGNVEPYRVFLYDVFQAEALQQELVTMGYIAEVIGCEEAGIMEVAREEKRGRKPDLRSQAERDAERATKARGRMQRRRQADKAVKKAAGTYRSAGRPKAFQPQSSPPPPAA